MDDAQRRTVAFAASEVRELEQRQRFDRWRERGVWQDMFEHFADDPDRESVMIDSSVVRAHAQAAGAPANKGGAPRHAATAEGASAVRVTSPSTR